MKTYHILFKTKETDFFSTGKDYTTEPKEKDSEEIADILDQWDKEYPKEKYPERQLLIIYLR